ncbi:MAG: hypothetical protein ACOWWO_19370 [Peptococcaceae bacterium]
MIDNVPGCVCLADILYDESGERHMIMMYAKALVSTDCGQNKTIND